MMRSRRNVIFLLLCSVLLAILFAAGASLSEPRAPFSLLIEQGTHHHALSLWRDGAGTWYAFLPSYAEPEYVKFRTSGKTFLLGELAVEDGMPLSAVELQQTYAIKEGRRGDSGSRVIFLQSENLPTVFIDTRSGRMEYLKYNKDRREEASFLLVDADGAETGFDVIPWISGRGNTTWLADKKGWTFRLPEATPLLGMRKADKWVLLANALDPSGGLRNFSAYKMVLEAGLEYSSDLRFVDLYLNKEYAGTYQLVERIDEGIDQLNIGDLDAGNAEANPLTDPDRAKITRLKDEDGTVIRTWAEIASPKDISGGYILERSYGAKLFDKPYLFVTDRQEGFVVRYPKAVSPEESGYISQLFQQAENMLFSDNAAEEAAGRKLTDLIDLDSWVKKYLVDEITKNEGAGATSSYFYKKAENDRLYAGPVWDYDKSFGTIQGALWYSPEGLSFCELHEACSHWWRHLYDFPEAYQLITQYYREIFRPYLWDLVNTQLDAWSAGISASYQMDWVRWRESHQTALRESIDEYIGDIFPAHQADWLRWGETYQLPDSPRPLEQVTREKLDDTVSFLKDWILRRMSFLDQVWLDGEVCYNVSLGDRVFSVPSGKAIPDVLELGNRTYINAVTGEIYDMNMPVTEDIVLEYKSDGSVSDGKVRLAEQLAEHKTFLLFSALCAMIVFSGLLLLKADIRRSGKGNRHGKRKKTS